MSADEMERVAHDLVWGAAGYSGQSLHDAILAALRAARASGREEMREAAIAACRANKGQSSEPLWKQASETCAVVVSALPLAPPKEKT